LLLVTGESITLGCPADLLPNSADVRFHGDSHSWPQFMYTGAMTSFPDCKLAGGEPTVLNDASAHSAKAHTL
jgi:hypothetical protein